MDELNPTVREQEIYEEMELTPETVSYTHLCKTPVMQYGGQVNMSARTADVK